MKKRIISILLVFVLLLSFVVSCGNDDGGNDGVNNGDKNESDSVSDTVDAVNPDTDASPDTEASFDSDATHNTSDKETSKTETPETEAESAPDKDHTLENEPVREVTTLKYVALGDSIAQGDGLADFETQRYPSILSNYINDLEYYDCKTYNYASAGNDSTDLVYLLKSGNARQLKEADIVTVSIGANNVFDAAIEKFSQYYIYSRTTEDNAAKKEMLKQVYDELMDANEKGIETFKIDIATIISLIRKSAPNARIIFQTIYNPFRNIDITHDDFALSVETEKFVVALNDIIHAEADAIGYEVCDIYSAFMKDTKLVNCELYDINKDDIMSLMMAMDPYPTAKGHALIADMLFSCLALK